MKHPKKIVALSYTLHTCDSREWHTTKSQGARKSKPRCRAWVMVAAAAAAAAGASERVAGRGNCHLPMSGQLLDGHVKLILKGWPQQIAVKLTAFLVPHDVCWTKPRDPQVKLVSSLLRTLRVDQENVPVVRVMSCKLHQTIDLPHQVGQIHSNSHDPPQLLVLKRAQAQLMVLSQSTTSYIGTQHSPHPPPYCNTKK